MITGVLDRRQGTKLRTARLLLRPPRVEDAGAVAGLADNPKVALQTARMPYPYRQRDAEDWIVRANAGSGEVTFLIVHAGSGQVLGAAGFGSVEGGEAEIDYWDASD